MRVDEMAEQEQSHGEQDEGGGGEERINARQAAQEAVAYMDEMIGQTPEVVTGVEPAEEDGWLVTVEVLELSRVPDATDVLGCYQVTIDSQGEPVAYRRVRRYHRGQVGEED